MDLQRTLFDERLPVHSPSGVAGVAAPGDVAGSLMRPVMCTSQDIAGQEPGGLIWRQFATGATNLPAGP